MIWYWIFFFLKWEIIIAKKNIVTFSIKAPRKQAVEGEKKKKKSPTRDPENRPSFRPDFLGQVGFQTAKLDFYRVRFRVTVNPTRTNISPMQEYQRLVAAQWFVLGVFVAVWYCMSRGSNFLVYLLFFCKVVFFCIMLFFCTVVFFLHSVFFFVVLVFCKIILVFPYL